MLHYRHATSSSPLLRFISISLQIHNFYKCIQKEDIISQHSQFNGGSVNGCLVCGAARWHPLCTSYSALPRVYQNEAAGALLLSNTQEHFDHVVVASRHPFLDMINELNDMLRHNKLQYARSVTSNHQQIKSRRLQSWSSFQCIFISPMVRFSNSNYR